MKDDAPEHRKMKRLARLLDIWHVTAVGIMECFWNAASKYHPDGNVAAAGAEAIAEWCKLDLIHHIDPNNLVGAMVEAGFLDRVGDMLLIHDWPEHCYIYTHHRLARRFQYFADGTTPNLAGFWDRKLLKTQVEDFYKAVGPHNAVVGPHNAVVGHCHVPTTAARVPSGAPPKPKPKPKPTSSVGISVVSSDSGNGLNGAAAASLNGHHDSVERWPLAARWLRETFVRSEPDTEPLAALCLDAIQKNGGDSSKFTDETFVLALQQAKFPKQQSARGFKATLPVVVANLSK